MQAALFARHFPLCGVVKGRDDESGWAVVKVGRLVDPLPLVPPTVIEILASSALNMLRGKIMNLAEEVVLSLIPGPLICGQTGITMLPGARQSGVR